MVSADVPVVFGEEKGSQGRISVSTLLEANKINASASLRPVKQAQESLVTGPLKLSSTLALLFAHAFSKQLSTAVTLSGNWGGHTEWWQIGSSWVNEGEGGYGKSRHENVERRQCKQDFNLQFTIIIIHYYLIFVPALDKKGTLKANWWYTKETKQESRLSAVVAIPSQHSPLGGGGGGKKDRDDRRKSWKTTLKNTKP